MYDFEPMPMEPEVPETFFLQIFQDMTKLDLINSEYNAWHSPSSIFAVKRTSEAGQVTLKMTEMLINKPEWRTPRWC